MISTSIDIHGISMDTPCIFHVYVSGVHKHCIYHVCTWYIPKKHIPDGPQHNVVEVILKM
jgi:hypothetical protein